MGCGPLRGAHGRFSIEKAYPVVRSKASSFTKQATIIRWKIDACSRMRSGLTLMTPQGQSTYDSSGRPSDPLLILRAVCLLKIYTIKRATSPCVSNSHASIKRADLAERNLSGHSPKRANLERMKLKRALKMGHLLGCRIPRRASCWPLSLNKLP
jgi:hypothetical protein